MSDESLHRIDEPNSYSASLVDMDESFSEYSVDVKPQIKTEFLPMLYQPTPPPMVVEQKKKPEERPVKHRNNGKISIANLPRRRLLSMSADSANEYLRNLQLNEQQNRSPPVRRVPQAPLQRPARVVTTPITTSIIVRSTLHNQMSPVAAMAENDPIGVASYVANSPRTESPEQAEEEQPQQSQPSQQQQQQQSQQQSQQIQELMRLINIGTFCVVCQQQYSSRKGLKTHQSSQKHKNNSQNMALARRQLLEQAQARANGT